MWVLKVETEWPTSKQ